MKIKVTFKDLDKLMRNNQVFTESAIRCACMACADKSLPVVLIDDPMSEQGSTNFIGAATLLECKYPELSFTALIDNEDAAKMLTDGHNQGFTLGGYALFNKTSKPVNDEQIVDAIMIDSLGCCENSIYNCSYEITD